MKTPSELGGLLKSLESLSRGEMVEIEILKDATV